jgi:hypothetical protein
MGMEALGSYRRESAIEERSDSVVAGTAAVGEFHAVRIIPLEKMRDGSPVVGVVSL